MRAMFIATTIMVSAAFLYYCIFYFPSSYLYVTKPTITVDSSEQNLKSRNIDISDILQQKDKLYLADALDVKDCYKKVINR